MHNDYTCKKIDEEHRSYVALRSYSLGVDDNRKQKFCQYIPVKLTIQSMFQNSSVCEQYLSPLTSQIGVFSDIVNGSVFRENT